MKKRITEYLEQVGLSELEAKIYSTLLETGSLNIADLADLIGIKRTRTYLHVDALVERGLLIKIVKGSKKQVAISHPTDNLRRLVDEKIKNTEKVASDFPAILKSITSSTALSQDMHGVEIQYYKGKHGVRKIYEEALQSKEVRIYAKVEETNKLFPDNVELFTTAFTNNKDLRVKEILYNSPFATKAADSIRSKSANYERYFYKFLPKDVKLIYTDTLIYDDKVAIINVRDQITGIVLQNIDHFRNSKALFDSYWNMLPESNHNL